MALLVYNENMAGNNELIQLWLSGQIKPSIFGPIHHSTHLGRAFYGGGLFSGTASGGLVNLLLINHESDSNFLWSVASGGDVYITLIENPTISASGTPLALFNRNRNSPIVTSNLLFQGASFSGGTYHPTFFVPGGSGPLAGGGRVSSDDEILLMYDVPYVLQIRNVTSQAQDVGVLVDVYSEIGKAASDP